MYQNETSNGNSKKGLEMAAIVAGGLIAGWTAYKYLRTSGYTFKDKTVLITGGSRGLGLIMARRLVDEGARIAIVARDRDEIARAADELRDRGGEILEVVCDVRVKDACERAVRETVRHFGGLDVLINNAGIIQAGPWEAQTEKDFRDSIDTHFWGPYYMIEASRPFLSVAGNARIINIASIAGKIAVPHLAPYCAGKFALAGLSAAARAELAKDDITVTTICPGLMRTGSHVNAEFKGQHQKEYAAFSIMDALPITSIDANRAAKQILEASRSGRAEAIISIQAQTMAALHNAFPEASATLLATVNRALPDGNSLTGKATGLQSTSSISPSILTANIDAQSELNNELKPGEEIVDRSNVK